MPRAVAKFMQLSAVVVGGAVVLALGLELVRPLRQRSTRTTTRRFRNLGLAACSGVVVRAFVLPTLLLCADVSRRKSWGIVHALRLPLPLKWLVSAVSLDLGIYGWHRMNHELRFLWRLHRVHHADLDVDVTTAFRFHPIEVWCSSFVRGIQVLIIGPSPAALLGYELVMQAATAFHHSNLRLPLSAERLSGALLITPRAHGIHHSIDPAQRNTNYGVVLSVWDRLFSSRNSSLEPQPVQLGLAELRDPSQQRLGQMLILPFVHPKEPAGETK